MEVCFVILFSHIFLLIILKSKSFHTKKVPTMSCISTIDSTTSTETTNNKVSCEFEVMGRVQGVFFRKYTQNQAKALGLRGWCRNTIAGTVAGELEGPQMKVMTMQQWLRVCGSPQSRIDRTVFSELKPIMDYKYNNFSIKK